MANKSTEKITKVLLQLMSVNDFYEITISEICANAGISRKTFYNHFKTKDQVLSKVCTGIINEYMMNSDDYVKNYEKESVEWLKNLAYNFFRKNKEHKDFLDLLFQQNLFHIYTNELQQRVLASDFILNQKMITDLRSDLKPYVIPSYTASVLKMYETWSSRGFQESPEEMSEIYLKVAHNLLKH